MGIYMKEHSKYWVWQLKRKYMFRELFLGTVIPNVGGFKGSYYNDYTILQLAFISDGF
jgi:hypothetical protein